MNHLIMALATGLYAGKLPKAPGTWGSLVAFLPWLLLKDLPLPIYVGAIAASLLLGFFVAGSAEKILDQPDAGSIVIDEIVGMFIALTLAPDHLAAWILGFLLFRFFDIRKPYPISWFDRHIHGGAGIMLDDVIAGIYACLSLHLLWWMFSIVFQ
ncbi:MAG: phosphatidylglycerophosphatase A [Desulfopila sp.]|jgi:phosphatidylglycerophosphatase A|nr:phosphatidylglycerophosphatase A [Desulfopila sp.]